MNGAGGAEIAVPPVVSSQNAGLPASADQMLMGLAGGIAFALVGLCLFRRFSRRTRMIGSSTNTYVQHMHESHRPSDAPELDAAAKVAVGVPINVPDKANISDNWQLNDAALAAKEEQARDALPTERL